MAVLEPAPIAFHGAQNPDVSGDVTHPLGRNQGQETCIAFTSKDHGADASLEASPTLRAMGHNGSHANGGGQVAVAFNAYQRSVDAAHWPLTSEQKGRSETGVILADQAVAFAQNQAVVFDTTQITSKANGSNPRPGDALQPRADGTHPPALATLAQAFDLRGREGGSMPEGPHDTANMRASSGGSSRSDIAAAAPTAQVRRLTPLECERLMGKPDGYTDVPFRGKPAADGPRYKALGNGIAVNELYWIGARIEAVDACP